MKTLKEMCAFVGVTGPVVDRFPFLYGVRPEIEIATSTGKPTGKRFRETLFTVSVLPVVDGKPLFSQRPPVSMRAMIARLESLSPISLDVEVVHGDHQLVPFDGMVTVHASSGASVITSVELLNADQVVVKTLVDFSRRPKPLAPLPLVTTFDWGQLAKGLYFIRVTHIGISSTGVEVQEPTFAFAKEG